MTLRVSPGPVLPSHGHTNRDLAPGGLLCVSLTGGLRMFPAPVPLLPAQVPPHHQVLSAQLPQWSVPQIYPIALLLPHAYANRCHVEQPRGLLLTSLVEEIHILIQVASVQMRRQRTVYVQ